MMDKMKLFRKKVIQKFSLEMCSDEFFLKHALRPNVKIDRPKHETVSSARSFLLETLRLRLMQTDRKE